MKTLYYITNKNATLSDGKIYSLLMHNFYALCDIGNGAELVKLCVEEMNNPNSDLTSKRAYKLINIEKASTASARVQISPSSVTNTANANISISDSFENVKNSLTVNIDKSEKLSDLEAEKKKYDDEIFLLRRDFDKLKRTDAPLAMARKNSQRSEDTSVKENITQSNENVKKNSIETDSKGIKLTREQSEALSDIRKQFFEVLDGAGVNYREGGAVESETKLSKSSNKRLTNGKGKGYNKNSTYDEFRTNGMQWAYNSKTQTGDIGYVFNPRKGKHCIIEETKTGEGYCD